MRRLAKYCGLIFALALVAIVQQGCSINAPDQGIIASANDSRQYRHVTLPNKLDVLLISDPTTDKAAASLDVYVGSYQNPDDRSGLLHFLEHMLFLGTEKYPDADEYQRFISEHGGSHNAGTGLENTNYFFDIDAAHLEPALDRFAQFFSEPTFDATYVDRERNAVESEYRLKIKDDSRRGLDALQEQINPKHPLSKFTVGNLDTLADRDGRPLRDELLAIYKKYYSANMMKLVVLGSESLDQLQAMVEPRFSVVANSNVDVAPLTEPLVTPERLPLQLSVVPLQESRELSLAFPMPKMTPHWQEKPANYLAALIGHEGSGSLLAALKERGWAESIRAGAGLEDRGGALFSVDIGLTPAGLEHQQQVVEMFFAWVDMIREKGIERWRYDETSRLSKIAFRFQEKQNPISYVSSLSGKMQRYAVEDVLRADYVMSRFDEQLVREVGARINPTNLLVTVTAPEVQATAISKMYQTPYAVKTVDEAILAKWKAPADYPELFLPAPNPYIPQSLELLSDVVVGETPAVLVQSDRVTAWHFPDTRYGVPKAHIIVSLETDQIDSLANFTQLELYLSYIQDQLSAQVYPASEAGLNFSLQPKSRGISIVIGGYSDRQITLLREILAELAAPQWDQARFDRVKQALVRDMANFRREYPFRQVMANFSEMMTGQWTPLQKSAAASDITMAQLQAFGAGLVDNLSLKVLISGNHSASSAAQIVDSLTTWTELQSAALTQSVAKLAVGEVRGQVPVDHSDAAALLYLQGRNDTLAERANTLLIGEMISAPFYTSLRTEKQLGYVVAAFASPQGRVPGLSLLVQSPTADVATLYAEYKRFLGTYLEQVMQVTDDDLARYKASVLTNLQETPKNLGELNSRFMESVVLGYADFDFRQQLSAEVSSVTIEQLQAAYKAIAVDEVRGLVVETVTQEAENTAVDLRESGSSYRYTF